MSTAFQWLEDPLDDETTVETLEGPYGLQILVFSGRKARAEAAARIAARQVEREREATAERRRGKRPASGGNARPGRRGGAA